jgi:hypothetical protein
LFRFDLFRLRNTPPSEYHYGGGGPGQYDAYQDALRPIYQHPVVELLGLGLPLLVHAAAAITRWKLFGVRFKQRSLRARLHFVTGVFLFLVITGHVIAPRGPSFVLDFNPGAAGLAFSLWWKPLVFYPYYVLFVLSAPLTTRPTACCWRWRRSGGQRPC